MPISVLILTLNEERILPECLAAGARVFQRRYDNELGQRMYSIREIPYKHSWVYNPDADEITAPELRDEMLEAVANATPAHAVFRMRRKDHFMGRWIRHSSLYPTWFARLYRPDAISFSNIIHCRCDVSGIEGKLWNHILHYSFNKGLGPWIEKHNRYSLDQAEDCMNSLRNSSVDLVGVLNLKDSVRRRRALKDISFRLPFRPLLRFLYMYFFRLGILDGAAGYTYCRLISMYEYLIVLKMAEIRRREEGLII